MIYIDFRRQLVATDKTVVEQVQQLEDFHDYCRENWLFQYDTYSEDFKFCCKEILTDHGYDDLEEIILIEDLPVWAYEEIELVMAKSWIFNNYKSYYDPDPQGVIKET